MASSGTGVGRLGFRESFNLILAHEFDSSLSDKFLVQNVKPLATIVALYLVFCVYIGPWFMKHREPFQLKKVMIGYNLFNVCLSAWIAYQSLANGWWNDYSFTCQPVDKSGSPKSIGMATASHVFFLSKLSELLDTVFFILRKKNNQVTFLHLYHHASTPFLLWILGKIVPGGHLTFAMLLNSMVHVVMYSYYLLAAMGPQYQKYLWWKKYLTIMQLTQFVVVILHTCQLFIYDCGLPLLAPCILVGNLILIFILFKHFYSQSYTKEKDTKKK